MHQPVAEVVAEGKRPQHRFAPRSGVQGEVHLDAGLRPVLMRLEDNFRVDATSALFGDLKALLGPACLANG